MKKTFYFLIVFAILSSIVGCKTPQQTVYVPLPVTDSSSESHHDSKTERDSVIKEKTVIVQVADSVLLAQLAAMGLQIDESKQYIMVLQKELERKISELSSSKSDTAIRYKEVPVPYPVEKLVEVERKQSKLHKIMIGSGVALWLIVFIIATGIILRKLERK